MCPRRELGPVLLCAVLLGACGDPAQSRPSQGKPAPEEAVAPSPGRPTKAPERVATEPRADDAGPADDRAGLAERLSSSRVVGVRPVSARSLSLKIALATGDRAAFKPLRKSNRSARWEVAFDLLAPEIEAGRTPLSTLRSIPLSQLVAMLEPSYPDLSRQLRDEALVDGRGLVGGAAIEWVEGLAPSRFEGAKGKALLWRALSPSGDRAVDDSTAAAASRLVVADYVLGNWDRFSGGNLFEGAGGALVLIDNNGSFAPWSDRQRERMEGQLEACTRFSRSQVERLRALTEESVRDALRSEEEKGIVSRLLDDDEIALVLSRRDAVLAAVAARAQERSEASVLSFP